MRTTTTHDPLGGGHPRLVLVHGGMMAHTENEPEELCSLSLRPGTNTIGSGADCDLRLPGLSACHVHIVRSDTDRYLLVNVSQSLHTRVHGRFAREVELHTGARIELAHHTLAFQRAEFADHGREYGGRQGGESWTGSRIGA